MSLKASKKLSIKKNKPLKDSPGAEVLKKLGLDACWATPLDPASMLDISTWALEKQAAAGPEDLPSAFLHRLWLLSPDARSPCCEPSHNDQDDTSKSPEETLSYSGGQNHFALNPLDLVAAVYMSCHTFLQQEVTSRMVQCQFAVPLVLPDIDPEEPSQLLLWPLRGVSGQWMSHVPGENRKVQWGYLPSTYMPVVSCLRLGDCSVSKSRVLNHVLGGREPCIDTFLHRGMDGGQLPRRIASGLVEVAWYRPAGGAADIFPVPFVISNLRGNAGTREQCLSLLCRASSAVVLFCGDLNEKERQILSACRNTARSLIVIELSDSQQDENAVVKFAGGNGKEHTELPQGSVLQGKALSEEELANRLGVILKGLLPDKLHLVTLEETANVAVELGLKVDEGAACKSAMATVENLLTGLDEGAAQFRERQFPLQGPLWRKLAETDKKESKQRREGQNIDSRLLKEKKDILAELGSYQMTPVMKMFTDVLFTADKVERTYFLTWLKLRLHQKQIEAQNKSQHLISTNSPSEQRDGYFDELHNGISDDREHSDSLCTDILLEDLPVSCSQETDPSWLGLEHFLREMGLIFELKELGHGSGSHNVLRLPSIAADLLLDGIPLEIMDGDASNVPTHWLSCVFAELKRRLPQHQCRTRVLTITGAHHARNAEVLSALFGVKFPDGGKRSTRGLYIIILCLPERLQKDMECDFLLLIDVEGLCSIAPENRNARLRDNEMATVATGMSDVLLQNISSGTESEADFTVTVNALLRIKEYGTLPICQVATQGEDIKSLLQASQLKRVTEMLQHEIGHRGSEKDENCAAESASCFTCVIGPWSNTPLSQSGRKQYCKAVVKLKKNLFGAMKRSLAQSQAPVLSEFVTRLCAVWEAVKSESFSIGLQDTGIALALSLLCTEHSQWEDVALKHVEGWLVAATKKMFATRAKASDVENVLLNELKVEAKEEVKAQVDKIRSKSEAHLMNDDLLKMHVEMFRSVLMSHTDNFEEKIGQELIQRLETASESFCSSTQLRAFEALLENKQESKLHELLEKNKSSDVLLEDSELEQVFDGAWTETLSNFDFRPSESDNIAARVTNILRENLISRGLQKHMRKVEALNHHQTSSLQVTDKYFGYRSRLKHMFDDNNRGQRLQAQQVADRVVDEYNRFVAEKTSLPADFSDSYITPLLENVERALVEESIEIRTAFEVDLKVYLCSAACQDFQKVHDRYAKSVELLRCITASKDTYLAEFIYEFRKKDQCRRVAEAFTSVVVKPTVLDYIYRPLEERIVEEITAKQLCYQSPRAFHQSLLEELIKEDRFESFQEYLLSFDGFRLRTIQERVIAHMSESPALDIWRQQRLGDIVGRVAVAVSQAAEGTSAGLSESKPLLERVCNVLEQDGDVRVSRSPLDGPLFSITTEWDRFVTCVMEMLASMRLELAREFSQNADMAQVLRCLPIQPQHSIISSVRGCGKQCPLCGAPCEVQEMGHEVHRALLHRPKGLLPYDANSLSFIIHSESCEQRKPDKTSCVQGTYFACRDLPSHYLDWKLFPEDLNGQKLCVYWRYVLARFNERLAQKYDEKPVTIPQEWKKISQEEALRSLREGFLTKPL
ncbi:up-regulator of cell proliferation [Betta splendens]|uniref:Up-regulator of cell proliferation n=1 Tax=Betta splendens TaxID=158456 RepID=A0A6P7P0Y4_BETSP|nr:up-regulator of cell proliferation [Betta splendens]XP_055370300.1 up-regulator of cell proliferation [Betta splendens]XP_055370301.1 up-regulator of cell proliferation [Betta splendens]